MREVERNAILKRCNDLPYAILVRWVQVWERWAARTQHAEQKQI